MSGTPRRPTARGLFAVVALAAVSAAAGFVSSAALASETGNGPRVVLSNAVDPERATDLGAAITGRAVSSAFALATGSVPAPPPRVHCPVPGSTFVDSWGFARSGGRGHKGVDMMAPYGTPILAPVAGTVRPSNSALGGVGFYLDDEAGNEYFGSHLASLDATGWVEAGQVIGTVGSSGNAGTPHLHFEIAPAGGASVNPYPFVLPWCLQDPDDPWSEVPRP